MNSSTEEGLLGRAYPEYSSKQYNFSTELRIKSNIVDAQENKSNSAENIVEQNSAFITDPQAEISDNTNDAKEYTANAIDTVEAPGTANIQEDEFIDDGIGEDYEGRAVSADISFSHVSEDPDRAVSTRALNSMLSFDIDSAAFLDKAESQFIVKSSQGPDTKEAMFQQALTLMDERCVSRDSSRMMGQLDHRYGYPLPHAEKSVYARSTTDTSVVATRDDVETPLVGVKHHPYGINRPERIYIHQRKPTPMEPLPAWKGYNGNVYFTPITVQPAKAVPHPPLPAPDLDQCSDKLQHILIRSRRPVRRSRSVSSKRTTTSSTASLSTSSNPRNSATSRGSGAVKRSQSMVSVKSKSSAFSKSSNVSRQMSLLDKRSVLSNFNENIEEDIQWIQGIESTGSLSILKNETEVKEQRKPTVRFEKEKICRGAPILRRSQSAKYTKTPIHPELKVHGGQCDKPTSNSQALIRARPHFPFYNYNRQIPKGINNSGLFSPQSYNSFLGSFDSLPPLEQLRASLKRMGSSSSKDELISMIPQRKSHSADIRKMPYVKFSPEYKHPHPPSRNITVK